MIGARLGFGPVSFPGPWLCLIAKEYFVLLIRLPCSISTGWLVLALSLLSPAKPLPLSCCFMILPETPVTMQTLPFFEIKLFHFCRLGVCCD